MRLISNKRGDEMVEAGIALPIVILGIMLLLRLFVFYIQILNTGISEHEKALLAWDSYSGKTMKIYESEARVEMLKGGLLGFNVDKSIESKAYFFNEDVLVRAGEALSGDEEGVSYEEFLDEEGIPGDEEVPDK